MENMSRMNGDDLENNESAGRDHDVINLLQKQAHSHTTKTGVHHYENGVHHFYTCTF